MAKALLLTSAAENRPLTKLSRDFIAETLSIYKEEHIALVDAEWDGKTTRGWFRMDEYPFTKPGHVEYVTAAMAALYLSQLSYVSARMLIENGVLPKGLGITVQHFFEMRDAGLLVFSRLNLRFRRAILRSSRMLLVEQTLLHVRCSFSHFFGTFAFSAGSGGLTGHVTVALPMPEAKTSPEK